VIQRILVRHGVSYDLAGLLLDDMKRALGFFATHPVVRPMDEDDAGGFNHS
jgi:glutamate decarboxylase